MLHNTKAWKDLYEDELVKENKRYWFEESED